MSNTTVIGIFPVDPLTGWDEHARFRSCDLCGASPLDSEPWLEFHYDSLWGLELCERCLPAYLETKPDEDGSVEEPA